MRMLMTPLLALMLVASPATAQEEEATEHAYPLNVQTQVVLTGGYTLNIKVAASGPTGPAFYTISDTTGAYTGTGQRLSTAMKALETAYYASGMTEEQLPAFFGNIQRVDANLKGEMSSGTGIDSVRLLKLGAPLDNANFVIFGWNEPLGAEDFENNGRMVMLKYVPLNTPGDMLVLSTRADEDSIY